MERIKAKDQELNFLGAEYKKNPGLFTRETFVDSPGFLETMGISLPENEKFPRGYLKLWPYDFIVEEVSADGSIATVDAGNLFKSECNKEDLTIYATLVKCKLSTFEAVQELSSFLGIDKKRVQYAGIKDKDALTAQIKSFRGADADKIEKIYSPYFFLKNVYSGKGAVETGSLKGNRFTILVRTDESFDEKLFLERVEIAKKDGFLNFFYSQRFGSPRFINWFWGLLILKGEYKNAVMSFLCAEGQREIAYFKNLRDEIKENLGNWEAVEKLIGPFPLVLHNEIRVVKYLKDNPDDFIGALQQISEQVQMWVFAYSSILFNRKISDLAAANEPIPEKLPLILNKDKDDWLPYFDFLAEEGIDTLPLKNLSPFPDIQWKKREIKTKDYAQIHKVKIIPKGVVMSFTLGKGSYATTFLSHFFQLVSGKPQENFSNKIVDLKEELGEGSLKEIIERFKEVVFSKSEDIFEKSE